MGNKRSITAIGLIAVLFCNVLSMYGQTKTQNPEQVQSADPAVAADAVLAGLRQGVMLAKQYAARQNTAGKKAQLQAAVEGSNFDGSIRWSASQDARNGETLTLSFHQYPYRYYTESSHEKRDVALSGTLRLRDAGASSGGKKYIAAAIRVRGANPVAAVTFDSDTDKTLAIGGYSFTADEFYKTLHSFGNEAQIYDKEKECALALIIIMASIDELDWGGANPFFETGAKLTEGKRAANWR
ncbi:MAG: hypothetical protein LBU99_06970, partial [Spirochaetaceae bacterium]|nr:hypothetical protein [Spirochaetaceae bacterium]